MANEAVLKYLLDTNRPYSCTDVTANLRGAYNKAAVQRALDALSESGQIRCKAYGKQKVYVAFQTDDKGGNDIGDLEERLQVLTKQLTDQTAALKASEAALKTLLSTPTTSNAMEALKNGIRKVESMRNKLNELKTSTNVVSAEEKSKILGEHGKLMKEYRKRKNICTQMMDVILDGYPKSKKCLIEDLCMETDEMVKFVPPTR